MDFLEVHTVFTFESVGWVDWKSRRQILSLVKLSLVKTSKGCSSSLCSLGYRKDAP
jgi:hypothetical protein